jgi:uracil-DNA glycosylase
MSETIVESAITYLRQQDELGMPPEYLLNVKPAAPAAQPAPAPVSSPLKTQPLASRSPLKLPSVAAPQPSLPTLPPAPAGSSYEEKRKALVSLYRTTENCRTCKLGGLRTKYVFGSGNAGARLMIIGEAPGEDEDKQGLPFVGAAGQLLTKMLAYIKLDRTTDVFIANVLKCRPPGNRTPEREEAAACLPILKRQIDIIAPRILLLLGKVAALELLGREETIVKLRGEKLDYNGIPVVVTYHPAALLRNAGYKPMAAEDFRKLRAMLDSL